MSVTTEYNYLDNGTQLKANSNEYTFYGWDGYVWEIDFPTDITNVLSIDFSTIPGNITNTTTDFDGALVIRALDASDAIIGSVTSSVVSASSSISASTLPLITLDGETVSKIQVRGPSTTGPNLSISSIDSTTFFEVTTGVQAALEYPYVQHGTNIDGVSSYGFTGQTQRWLITFPDAIENVESVDFTGMGSGGNLATLRNTTENYNGTFSLRIRDASDSVIASGSLYITAGSTRSISEMGIIDIGGLTVKSILAHRTDNANFSWNNVDETSEYIINVIRPTEIVVSNLQASIVTLDWSVSTNSNSDGNTYRVVNRVEHTERNIANDNDVVLQNVGTGSSVTLTGLSASTAYVLALQVFGTEWFDVSQVSITTAAEDEDEEDISSSLVIAFPRDGLQGEIASSGSVSTGDIVTSNSYLIEQKAASGETEVSNYVFFRDTTTDQRICGLEHIRTVDEGISSCSSDIRLGHVSSSNIRSVQDVLEYNKTNTMVRSIDDSENENTVVIDEEGLSLGSDSAGLILGENGEFGIFYDSVNDILQIKHLDQGTGLYVVKREFSN